MLQGVYEPFHEPKLARGSARCQPWLEKAEQQHISCCIINAIKEFLPNFSSVVSAWNPKVTLENLQPYPHESENIWMYFCLFISSDRVPWANIPRLHCRRWLQDDLSSSIIEEELTFADFLMVYKSMEMSIAQYMQLGIMWVANKSDRLITD